MFLYKIHERLLQTSFFFQEVKQSDDETSMTIRFALRNNNKF